MHTLVNNTHTTFTSAQNAMEKALAHRGLVCLPLALPRRVVMLCVSRRRDSARVYQFTLKHDLLKRNLSIESKFIPQLNTLQHDCLNETSALKRNSFLNWTDLHLNITCLIETFALKQYNSYLNWIPLNMTCLNETSASKRFTLKTDRTKNEPYEIISIAKFIPQLWPKFNGLLDYMAHLHGLSKDIIFIILLM